VRPKIRHRRGREKNRADDKGNGAEVHELKGDHRPSLHDLKRVDTCSRDEEQTSDQK
jgi:hypothetical protein